MGQTRGVVIAGISGGSGKSVVAVGLAAALRRAQFRVQPFKKGPDYIDAGWLQLASAGTCYNLDPYLMSREAIESSFARRACGADYVIVEGNRGLFDGVNLKGGYSTAELSLMLGLPVILVVSCTKITRTVAALVLGCKFFDPRLRIAGVVLNQVATERQRRLISEAVAEYTGIPVLGAIPRLKADIFPMRHLGLTPHQEYDDSARALTTLAELAKDNLDLKKVKKVMQPISFPVPEPRPEDMHATSESGRVRIGVLQDAVFQFYYPENLEALEQQGAELVYVNALSDRELPTVDGLYIGGGFPENAASQLAANTSFLDSVKKAVASWLPVYAECGGLIYLGRSISLEEHRFALVGALPVDFSMSQKPQAHGYSIFRVDRDNPFYAKGSEIKGHEFRYSKVERWDGKEEQLVVQMQRGTGFIGGRDGVTCKNVFAMYTHIHAEGTPQWARGFVAACLAEKELRRSGARGSAR
ncbi:MAG: cobyrinic acid a,c-diamide synthase [Deltaproteobacteria bacterium]|nr:MAG: cobyrinic acid a,c-diamide synthase [Deltaproteobacteria bacterium]